MNAPLHIRTRAYTYTGAHARMSFYTHATRINSTQVYSMDVPLHTCHTHTHMILSLSSFCLRIYVILRKYNTYTGAHARMCPYTLTTRMYMYAGAQYACIPTRMPHAYTQKCACTRVLLHALNTHIHIHRCTCINMPLRARHAHVYILYT